MCCLFSHIKLFVYWLSIVTIKGFKPHLIQTYIWTNKVKYINCYWHSRTVTKPSILSWILEETKFNCDIKFLISSGEKLFIKRILHYWKGLKAETIASKWCEIDNWSDWSTGYIFCDGKKQSNFLHRKHHQKAHIQKNIHLIYKKYYYKDKQN